MQSKPGDSRVGDIAVATFASIALGFIVLKWELVAKAVGIDLDIDRGTSIVTIEYVIGFAATFFLGYTFHKYPIWCGIWFMFGPILIIHAVYFSVHGVPNLWPVEIMLLMLLTIPYIGLACAGAFVHRKAIAKRTKSN